MVISDRAWFAVQTWPRYEKKVAAELNNKAVEVFLPLQKSLHQWSDRRRMVQLPLFPGYVFVNIPEKSSCRVPVLHTNGVARFVGFTVSGTPIPGSEIESIRSVLKTGVQFQPHAFLKAGDHVRIRGGSLDGLEGILVGRNADLSLVVSVNIIQRSLAVRVAGYQIEAA